MGRFSPGCGGISDCPMEGGQGSLKGALVFVSAAECAGTTALRSMPQPAIDQLSTPLTQPRPRSGSQGAKERDHLGHGGPRSASRAARGRSPAAALLARVRTRDSEPSRSLAGETEG